VPGSQLAPYDTLGPERVRGLQPPEKLSIDLLRPAQTNPQVPPVCGHLVVFFDARALDVGFGFERQQERFLARRDAGEDDLLGTSVKGPRARVFVRSRRYIAATDGATRVKC
jgi:hypothetical protein